MADIGVVIGLCAAVGLCAWILADALQIPGILVYLVLGVVLGPAVSGAVPVDVVKAAVPHLVPLAAAVILFEGGLSLDYKAIRSATGPLRRMLTIGALVSFVGATFVAWAIAGLAFGPALIFGSLMVVTGPTVTLPILRRTPLSPRVRALLHWEAILVDPIGVVLSVATAAWVLHGATVGLVPLRDLFVQLVAGGALGAAIGAGAAFVLQLPSFERRPERANVLTIATAVGAWALGELVVKEGGIAAVTVGGLVLAVLGGPALQRVRHFNEQVTTMLVGTLFVLLAASTDPAPALALGARGVLSVCAIALVVRPIAIGWSTYGEGLALVERIYVAWIGPKGIIAASVAALSAIKMRQNGMEGGDGLEALAFATIAGTVFVQGLSAAPVARWLGVDRADAGAVLLVGGALGTPVGEALEKRGIHVVLVDSNEEKVRNANERGLDARRGSAVDRRLLLDCIGGAEVGTMVAMTANPEVNALAAALARELLGPESGFRADIPEARLGDLGPEDRTAFLGPINVARIAGEIEAGRVKIVEVQLTSDGVLEAVGRRFPLFRLRGGGAAVVVRGMQFQAGDALLCLEHVAAEATAEPVPERAGEPAESPPQGPQVVG